MRSASGGVERRAGRDRGGGRREPVARRVAGRAGVARSRTADAGRRAWTARCRSAGRAARWRLLALSAGGRCPCSGCGTGAAAPLAAGDGTGRWRVMNTQHRGAAEPARGAAGDEVAGGSSRAAGGGRRPARCAVARELGRARRRGADRHGPAAGRGERAARRAGGARTRCCRARRRGPAAGVGGGVDGRAAGGRAGRRAAWRSSRPTADPRPLCSPAAGARLRDCCSSATTSSVGRVARARGASRRAAAAGARSRPARARRSGGPTLHGVIARRRAARALAGRARAALGVRAAPRRGPGEVWADGSRAERRALLERLRASDPARGARAAREHVRRGDVGGPRRRSWRRSPTGSRDADEPLLEPALDDRAQAACATRPRSCSRGCRARRSRSAHGRARARRCCASRTADRGRRCPGRRTRPRSATGSTPRGRRSERLTELLATAPLETWPLDWRRCRSPTTSAPPCTRAGRRRRSGSATPSGRARCGASDPRPARGAARATRPSALAAAADDPCDAARHARAAVGAASSRSAVVELDPAARASAASAGDARWSGYRLDPSLEPRSSRCATSAGATSAALRHASRLRAAMLRELA